MYGGSTEVGWQNVSDSKWLECRLIWRTGGLSLPECLHQDRQCALVPGHLRGNGHAEQWYAWWTNIPASSCQLMALCSRQTPRSLDGRFRLLISPPWRWCTVDRTRTDSVEPVIASCWLEDYWRQACTYEQRFRNQATYWDHRAEQRARLEIRVECWEPQCRRHRSSRWARRKDFTTDEVKNIHTAKCSIVISIISYFNTSTIKYFELMNCFKFIKFKFPVKPGLLCR